MRFEILNVLGRRRRLAGLGVVVALAATAALATAAFAATSTHTRSTVDSLEFGYDGVQQLSYGNTLLTWRRLRSPKVESVFFQQSALNLQALASGQVQLSQDASAVSLPAIAKGADLKIIGATVVHSWVLMVSSDIKSLADLKGKKLAAHSETSVSALFARAECKIAGCQVVYIPGSPVRAQAILSGQIAAATVFAADALHAQAQAPGKTHVLVYFTHVPIPDLYVVAQTSWLKDHQDEAVAVLKGIIQTARSMKNDPGDAVKGLRRIFPDESPKILREVVDTYVNRGGWAQDGGYESVRTIAKTVAYMKSSGAIPADAPNAAAAYVDTRPLQKALKSFPKSKKPAKKKARH